MLKNPIYSVTVKSFLFSLPSSLPSIHTWKHDVFLTAITYFIIKLTLTKKIYNSLNFSSICKMMMCYHYRQSTLKKNIFFRNHCLPGTYLLSDVGFVCLEDLVETKLVKMWSFVVVLPINVSGFFCMLIACISTIYCQIIVGFMIVQHFDCLF